MIAVAATALSAAVLLCPKSSRRRLTGVAPTGVAGRREVPRAALASIAVLLPAVGLLTLPLTAVLAGSILAATLSLRHRRRRRRERGRAESRQLETAIDVLVGELRIGSHPAEAFAVAAQETGGPVAPACRAVAARARLGADVAAGLRGVGETSALPSHWERLAVCWQLAAEHGLAMSALMQTAQRDIAERQRFREQVHSAMAGARATATILAGLPMLSVLMGQLIGARPLPFLVGGGAGGWLLVVGVTLVCAGLLWADRITERVTA